MLFSVPFSSEEKAAAGERSEGAAYQQLAAARMEAGNEDTSIRSESLLDFGSAPVKRLGTREGEGWRRIERLQADGALVKRTARGQR